MSHEITQRADKSYEFAYARTPAWHGLGSELQPNATIEDWKIASGLEWEVFQSLCMYQSIEGQHVFDDKQVLFRSDTKKPLSVIGKDYKIVQPGQVLEFFRDLTELNGFKLSAAGSLFGGKKFWATADVGKTFSAVPGDEIKGYLLLVTSVDGTLSTQARFTSTRVVCNNTLTVAMGDKSKNVIKKTHASDFDPRAVKLELGLIDSSWETFSNNIKKMTEIKVTDQFAQEYFQKKFYNPAVAVEDQSTQTHNKIAKLMALYKTGAGADMSYGTAWGILNAVTDMGTHGTREKQDPSRKFWNSTFGNNDTTKSDVYNDMIAMSV